MITKVIRSEVNVDGKEPEVHIHYVYGYDRPLQEYFLQAVGVSMFHNPGGGGELDVETVISDKPVGLVGSLSPVYGSGINLLNTAANLALVLPEAHAEQAAMDLPILGMTSEQQIAEQAFNSHMGSQRPTQADNKPKDDDGFFEAVKEYEQQIIEEEQEYIKMQEMDAEDEILMNPDIFPVNRPRYRRVDDLIRSVLEDFDNCSDKGKQTLEAQSTLDDYIEVLDSLCKQFQKRRTSDVTREDSSSNSRTI